MSSPTSRWTLEDGTRGIGFPGVSWLLRPDGNVHVEWLRMFGVKTLIDITSPPPTIEEFEKAWAQAPH